MKWVNSVGNNNNEILFKETVYQRSQISRWSMDRFRGKWRFCRKSQIFPASPVYLTPCSRTRWRSSFGILYRRKRSIKLGLCPY